MTNTIYNSNKQNFIDEFGRIDAMDTDDILDFMNHGYHPSYPGYDDNFFKYSCSLYHHMLKGINTNNLKILEIGCGRGGGTQVIKGFGLSEIHACDLVPSNIEHCKKKFDGINFKVSDAMNLDYEDSYFDIILNVESSHCYIDKRKFFHEVRRVMKPDGVFLYADLDASIENILERDFHFKYIMREDITKNVQQSCEHFTQDILTMKESDLKQFLLYIYKNRSVAYANRDDIFIKYVCTNNLDIVKW